MTDYSELKRLAEAAQASCVETGQRWPEADDWFEPDLISEEMDFVKGASPKVVLTLIAENEALRNRFSPCPQCSDTGRVKSIDGKDSGSCHKCFAADAMRYRWLRDKAGAADWEYFGYQSPETTDGEIDQWMKECPNG